MKKIGFIDYFLDEWHANNYPQWIRENCKTHGRDMELAYAWADIDQPGGLSTQAWCAKHDVTACASIDELIEMSDYLVVLSPDNPEHHERLAEKALASGKPVYIDKTFSPDLASGIRLFERAEQHHTPMFSSSALRFAEELAQFPDTQVNPQILEQVSTLGPGIFANYSVHQLEMIVALMGPGAQRVKAVSTQHSHLVVYDYGDGRLASLLQIQDTPFQVSLQLRDGTGLFIGQCSDIFPRMIHAILDFFESGQPPVEKTETLAIMAMIEAGGKALQNPDAWVSVESV